MDLQLSYDLILSWIFLQLKHTCFVLLFYFVIFIVKMNVFRTTYIIQIWHLRTVYHARF